MHSSGFRHFAFPAGVYAVLLHISKDEAIETFFERQKLLLQREHQLFLRERRFFLRQRKFFLRERRLLQPRVGYRLLSFDNFKASHYKRSRK